MGCVWHEDGDGQWMRGGSCCPWNHEGQQSTAWRLAGGRGIGGAYRWSRGVWLRVSVCGSCRCR